MWIWVLYIHSSHVGISERLIKVTKEIDQPENPHLIKVAVIGAANAGKSTLVNKIVGEEVTHSIFTFEEKRLIQIL